MLTNNTHKGGRTMIRAHRQRRWLAATVLAVALFGMAAAPALADDPVAMATAMKLAVEAGRLAYRAGRIPRRSHASASSPVEGRITPAAAVAGGRAGA